MFGKLRRIFSSEYRNVSRRKYLTSVFLGQLKSSNKNPSREAEGSVTFLLTKNPVVFRLDGYCDPGRQLTLSGPVNNSDSCLRRAENTTSHRHRLGPYRTATYPLFAVHKPAPTVTGDPLASPDAQGVSSIRRRRTGNSHVW